MNKTFRRLQRRQGPDSERIQNKCENEQSTLYQPDNLAILIMCLLSEVAPSD